MLSLSTAHVYQGPISEGCNVTTIRFIPVLGCIRARQSISERQPCHICIPQAIPTAVPLVSQVLAKYQAFASTHLQKAPHEEGVHNGAWR